MCHDGFLTNDFLQLVVKTMDSFMSSKGWGGWVWDEPYIGVFPFSTSGQFKDYYAIRKQDNNGELMLATTVNLDGLLDDIIFRGCGFVKYRPSGEYVSKVDTKSKV
jgi:hypothetical protein